MMIKRTFLGIDKTILCGLAFYAGTILGGMIASLTGLPVPSLPGGSDAATLGLYTLVGSVLIVLATAMGLTSFLIDQQVPMRILGFLEQTITSRILFLILLNIFLLVVGCLMDIFSAIIVFVPLILPVAEAFGVDPVHLGIIMLANLEIGYSTPPVGINLFLSSLRFNKPILVLYRATLPFLLIYLVALMIITYVPELSLILLP